MAHQLPGLDEEGDEGEDHAHKGSILQEHLLEAVGLHVGDPDGSQREEGNGCRPPELPVHEMDHPSLHCLLVHLLLALLVALLVVPLPVTPTVALGHQLSVFTGQNHLLHKGGGQTQQAFPIGRLSYLLGKLSEDLLYLLGVGLGGSDSEVG